MNTPNVLQFPNVSSNPISDALRQSCVIVSIETRALGLSRTDKDASAQADVFAKAKDGTCRVTASRLTGADQLHLAFKNLHQTIRENLYAHSTAWGQTGRRLMPNGNLAKWATEHNRLIGEHDKMLADLRSKAPAIIAEARVNLGDLKVKPPTEGELCSAYGVSHIVEPLPNEGDFDGFPSEAAQALKRQLHANIEAAAEMSKQDAVKRLKEPLEKFMERMIAIDERNHELMQGRNPGRTGVLRESIVDGMQDVIGAFATLNPLGDARLKGIEQKLAFLRDVSSEDLRKDDATRQRAEKEAKEVLQEVEDFLIPSMKVG